MRLIRLFIGIVALLAGAQASAQPVGKVIHLVVPFDAGGAREVLREASIASWARR